jgi:hypothetical protein
VETTALKSVRIPAIRKLAAEAADNTILDETNSTCSKAQRAPTGGRHTAEELLQTAGAAPF